MRPLRNTGPHHGDVVEVAGAEPGIVGDDDVAGLQRFGRIALQHVAQRDRRAADERRHAEGALRDGVGLGVEHHAGEIVALVDDGRERGAHQRRDDLVDERDQPVPHDAEADGVEGLVAHGARPASHVPRLGDEVVAGIDGAISPAPITQVLSRSSIRAGPVTDRAGRERVAVVDRPLGHAAAHRDRRRAACP